MPSRNQIAHLLAGQLSEADALATLGELTPDFLDVDIFHDTWLEVALTAAPDLPPLDPDLSSRLMDCCGTGGSGLARFNTSTCTAFVLAAAGIPVLKFGNRSQTSASGSFDFLGALGIPDHVPLHHLPRLMESVGLAFLFAPQCYPQLATLAPLRKALGHKTIFNFLGPLLHPYEPPYRLLGVSDPKMFALMGQWLSLSKTNQRSLLVHGHSHLDELCVEGPSDVLMIEPGGQVLPTVFEPQWLVPQDRELLQGYHQEPFGPEANEKRFESIVFGEDTTSPAYWSLCLNAAAGLSVTGHVATLEEGLQEAQGLIASGKVRDQVKKTLAAYDAIATGRVSP